MIRIALLLCMTALPASAQFQLGSDGPGGFSVWHGDHWDWMGIHTDPQSVPEASPTLLLAAAGAALILRRTGGAK